MSLTIGTKHISLDPPYPPGMHPAILVVGALEEAASQADRETFGASTDAYDELFNAVVAAVTPPQTNVGYVQRTIEAQVKTSSYFRVHILLKKFLDTLPTVDAEHMFIIDIVTDETIRLHDPRLKINVRSEI